MFNHAKSTVGHVYINFNVFQRTHMHVCIWERRIIIVWYSGKPSWKKNNNKMLNIDSLSQKHFLSLMICEFIVNQFVARADVWQGLIYQIRIRVRLLSDLKCLATRLR